MPVTAVRDEGALRMWVCRLPVHIGPLGSYEFAEDYRKIGAICRVDVGIAPYSISGSYMQIHLNFSKFSRSDGQTEASAPTKGLTVLPQTAPTFTLPCRRG